MDVQQLRIGYRNETGEDLDIFVQYQGAQPVLVIRKRQARNPVGIILPRGVVVEDPLKGKVPGA